MNDDLITVRLSRTRWHGLVAKGLVVLMLGFGLGSSMDAGDREKAERARTLTLAQYTSEFDHYKAELVEEVWPRSMNLTVAIVFTAAIFGLYEGVGLAVGWLLAGRGASAARVDDASQGSTRDAGAHR